jgi:hypothetical protein
MCAYVSYSCAGCSVTSCSTPINGQAFAFEIKFSSVDQVQQHLCVHAYSLTRTSLALQAPRDVFLAAANDDQRQRCMRVIQAASADSVSFTLQGIATTVALTRDLIGMQSLPAVNAVLAALGKAAAKGLDAKSLKQAGLTWGELEYLGYDLAALEAGGFSHEELINNEHPRVTVVRIMHGTIAQILQLLAKTRLRHAFIHLHNGTL